MTLTQPDDWHLHLRAGRAMADVVGFSARQMARAVVMPNLSVPITTVAQAQAYRQDILAALPSDSGFTPLMTLYLTDNTTPAEMTKAKNSKIIIGAKLYPAGASTNSDKAVSHISQIYGVLETMQAINMPLLIHGEVADKAVDIFDREAVFIDTILAKIVQDFPALRIVLEHITTKEAVDFILASPSHIRATITPHHLLSNRNNMLSGGIKPHYFCLPILKRENPHQRALLKAATSGSTKFFLGTDSAPHSKGKKESSCGCAGIFNAHIAIELYAIAFEQAGKLDKLEGFASHFGADFYRLPRNNKTLTLHPVPQTIPHHYPFAGTTLIPYMAGSTLNWTAKLNP